MPSDTDTMMVSESNIIDFRQLMRLKSRAPSLSQDEMAPLVDKIQINEETEPQQVDKAPIREVILLSPDQLLLEKLAEREEIIKKLSIELDEFKRISLFEFDSLDLPDNYYENDTYSDH